MEVLFRVFWYIFRYFSEMLNYVIVHSLWTKVHFHQILSTFIVSKLSRVNHSHWYELIFISILGSRWLILSGGKEEMEESKVFTFLNLVTWEGLWISMTDKIMWWAPVCSLPHVCLTSLISQLSAASDIQSFFIALVMIPAIWFSVNSWTQSIARNYSFQKNNIKSRIFPSVSDVKALISLKIILKDNE